MRPSPSLTRLRWSSANLFAACLFLACRCTPLARWPGRLLDGSCGRCCSANFFARWLLLARPCTAPARWPGQLPHSCGQQRRAFLLPTWLDPLRGALCERAGFRTCIHMRSECVMALVPLPLLPVAPIIITSPKGCLKRSPEETRAILATGAL